jgi:hypothetical protein
MSEPSCLRSPSEYTASIRTTHSGTVRGNPGPAEQWGRSMPDGSWIGNVPGQIKVERGPFDDDCVSAGVLRVRDRGTGMWRGRLRLARNLREVAALGTAPPHAWLPGRFQERASRLGGKEGCRLARPVPTRSRGGLEGSGSWDRVRGTGMWRGRLRLARNLREVAALGTAPPHAWLPGASRPAACCLQGRGGAAAVHGEAEFGEDVVVDVVELFVDLGAGEAGKIEEEAEVVEAAEDVVVHADDVGNVVW